MAFSAWLWSEAAVHFVNWLPAEALTIALLRNFQALLLPGLEAAVHFLDGITFHGELHRGVGAHVAVLGIAVNDVHRIPAQTGQGAPFFLGKTDRPRDMAFLEIFGFPHVYDGHILSFLNLVAYFDGSGRESHFVREELLRFGRVALDCFGHNDFLFLQFGFSVHVGHAIHVQHHARLFLEALTNLRSSSGIFSGGRTKSTLPEA